MKKQPVQLREIGEPRFVEISRRKSDLRNYDLVERTIDKAGPRGAKYYTDCSGWQKRDGKYGVVVQYFGLKRAGS
jgi:hypothetical protein